MPLTQIVLVNYGSVPQSVWDFIREVREEMAEEDFEKLVSKYEAIPDEYYGENRICAATC